jgi:hypothetical protein
MMDRNKLLTIGSKELHRLSREQNGIHLTVRCLTDLEYRIALVVKVKIFCRHRCERQYGGHRIRQDGAIWEAVPEDDGSVHGY